MSELRKAGVAARVAVKRAHPNATSSYTGPNSAVVYDAKSDAVLGESIAQEDSVERAWVDAMQRLATHQPDGAQTLHATASDIEAGPASP